MGQGRIGCPQSASSSVFQTYRVFSTISMLIQPFVSGPTDKIGLYNIFTVILDQKTKKLKSYGDVSKSRGIPYYYYYSLVLPRLYGCREADCRGPSHKNDPNSRQIVSFFLPGPSHVPPGRDLRRRYPGDGFFRQCSRPAALDRLHPPSNSPAGSKTHRE